jgi:DNA-directed RNA polymerase specialized sigma24 family protein
MFSLRKRLPSGRTRQQASATDFCKVFHQDMDVLYWLALALTNDEDRAEQCFVSGLEECIAGNSVFQEWARSWSRRVVIKNAVRLMSPRPGMILPSLVIRRKERPAGEAEVALATLAQLEPFDRFVFVMTVLEGYTDQDCATLLGCSSAQLVEARLRAFHQVGRGIRHFSARPEHHESERLEPAVLHDTDIA